MKQQRWQHFTSSPSSSCLNWRRGSEKAVAEVAALILLQDTKSEEGVAKRGSSKNVIAIIATEVAAVEAAVAVQLQQLNLRWRKKRGIGDSLC